MNFEQALIALREGAIMTREFWDDKHQRVTLEGGAGFEKFYKVVPCKVAHYNHAKLAYNPTVNDILATDWTVIK